MSAALAILRPVVALFVDDRALALRVLAVIIVAGIVRALLPDTTWLSGGILLLGCLGTLIATCTSAARR